MKKNIKERHLKALREEKITIEDLEIKIKYWIRNYGVNDGTTIKLKETLEEYRQEIQ